MKKWFSSFSSSESLEKLHQLGAEIQSGGNQSLMMQYQAGIPLSETEDFPFVLGLLPWRHQVDIVSKCKTLDEAIFYLRESVFEGWSRQTLNNALKSNLYESSGKAISNFPEYLPEAQCRLAQEITKDNYDFGFITVPVDYKEEHLEAAVERNITRFLR